MPEEIEGFKDGVYKGDGYTSVRDFIAYYENPVYGSGWTVITAHNIALAWEGARKLYDGVYQVVQADEERSNESGWF